MIRKSFTDANNKKGTVGTKVQYGGYGEPTGNILTVKEIISKGKGGTRIYFEEGGHGNSSWYVIVDRTEKGNA